MSTCNPLVIRDSQNHAFDPVHDTDQATIHCNDGYIFNHDLLHQSGKIKCMSNPTDELLNNWYVGSAFGRRG